MNKNQNKIDSKLVLEFQSGNKKALVQLVKRWHKIFCDKAFWIVKDADVSKDIAQESWKLIIAKIGDLKHPERFGSWALRIVYNKSFDSIRKASKARQVAEDYKYEQSVLIEETNTDLDDKKIKILQAVNELSKDHQNIIKLFYVNDYSLKEIASILNISVGTAKSRLFHAREKLKNILT